MSVLGGFNEFRKPIFRFKNVHLHVDVLSLELNLEDSTLTETVENNQIQSSRARFCNLPIC
jgi:hypothetical protein